MKIVDFVLLNILMNSLNNLVTGFNAKERSTSGSTNIMLGLKAGSCSCMEDTDFSVCSYLPTNSRNKHFCSYLMYAYSKLTFEIAFLKIYETYSVNCTDIFRPNLWPHFILQFRPNRIKCIISENIFTVNILFWNRSVMPQLIPKHLRFSFIISG